MPENNYVAIRMDWSENLNLQQTREEEKSAYYHDITVLVKTAVIYEASGKVTAAATISDAKSHGAAAAWASLMKILKSVGLETMQGKQCMFVITDSPLNQYHNGAEMYLTKKYAEEHGIEVIWVFTESGHRKGPMDGVGAALKTMADQMIEFNPGTVVTCTKELIPLLPASNIIASTYEQADVDIVQAKIPKKIGIMWTSFGISQVHEVRLSSSQGSSFEWKRLSADEDYTTVKF